MVTFVTGQRHIKTPNFTLRVAFCGAQVSCALRIEAAGGFVLRISVPMLMTVTSSRRLAARARVREIGHPGLGLALPRPDSFKIFPVALRSHFGRINSKKGGQCIVRAGIVRADFGGGQFHKSE